TESLKFRGSYSTAFRAPALIELDSTNSGLIVNANDSARGGLSPLFSLVGSNSGLGPEEARSWNTGVEFAPTQAPWLQFSVSYFDVYYEERVDVPAVGFTDILRVLEREPLFASL